MCHIKIEATITVTGFDRYTKKAYLGPWLLLLQMKEATRRTVRVCDLVKVY